jgi:hypothetical protein
VAERFETMRGSTIDKPRVTNGGEVATAAEFVHDLTTKWFLRVGASSVMYFRSRMVEGDLAYAIHSADGVPVSVVEDIDAATILASDYGMAGVTVH